MGNGLPEVAELFLELVRVPSPSGEERVVADQVIEYLRALALPVDEDDAGGRIDSTIGNLLCRIAPNGEGAPLFFCAHLDTVPPEGPIDPVVEDGVVWNGGGTILGADNKAAVAAMLDELASRDDLDLGRVGAAGVSLGGYYAPRAAGMAAALPYCDAFVPGHNLFALSEAIEEIGAHR